MNEGQLTGAALSANTSHDVFGRYRVLRTLAFGGMAQILLAEELGSGQQVVLKRILPHFASDPDFVQYFVHEGRLGQRLRHPNIVETLETGQVGEAYYLALEYLRGQPCIELLRAATRAKVELPLGAAVRIVADAARGLHYAHTAGGDDGRPLGVVHRDVTPHNLFVCADGVTKVLDFGIAKAASQLHHTRTGTIKGKFAYLAPEQIRGEPIDCRVDVFALGIVLHELLTLRPLFRGQNDAETLQRVLTYEVPPPELVRRAVPPGLGAVALRALMRERDRRLPSAEALADSIEAVAAAEGIDASPARVAELVAELCPPGEAVLRETPADGHQKLNVPATGSQPALELPATGLQLPLGELRHPKAVAALGEADDELRERRRRRAARAALAVVAGGAVIALVIGAGTCLGRAPRTAQHAAAPAPAELAAPVAPQPASPPTPLVAAVTPAAHVDVPERPRPGDDEATLRLLTDGVVGFQVDGHLARINADGSLHLAAGHHRVTISGASYATPRSLEVDLKPREVAVRPVSRGRGRLRVAVTPWAEVMIDGRPYGVTPLQPLDLAEGLHQVTLRNSELSAAQKRRVVIAPGKEQLLKVDLFTR